MLKVDTIIHTVRYVGVTKLAAALVSTLEFKDDWTLYVL
jgi:hypothetical protein